MCGPRFIFHSPTDGHIGCFTVLYTVLWWTSSCVSFSCGGVYLSQVGCPQMRVERRVLSPCVLTSFLGPQVHDFQPIFLCPPTFSLPCFTPPLTQDTRTKTWPWELTLHTPQGLSFVTLVKFLHLIEPIFSQLYNVGGKSSSLTKLLGRFKDTLQGGIKILK